MATELVVRPAGITDSRTIEELKWMQHQVHQLLDEVLQEGIDNDYAIIPGTKKKTLLKPGAEKICNLFRFVPTLRVEEYRDGDDVTFRVTVSLSAASGNLLGEGIGQASTKETKFAWRKAVCIEEYEATDPSKRRVKWFVDNAGNADTILQVRECPADKENNMLKIGKKRGLIDCVLTVTGCSNLFTQDREEDIPENGAAPRATTTKKTAAPAKDQGPAVEPKQAGKFYYVWSKDRNPPRTAEEVKLYLQRVCGVDDSRKMPAKFYSEACRWALSMEPVPAEKAAEAAEASKDGPSPAETEARAAFEVLGWNEATQKRFIEQYGNDWNKILGEAKVLVAKRKDNF